jgi:type VI secretion system protein ImpB
MAGESIQKKLDRVRRRGTNWKYEVEFADGRVEMMTLPYVVGVFGDFSGKPATALPPWEDRNFVTIDRDNCSEVMQSFGTRAAFRVPDRISGEEGREFVVDLRFEELSDFSPEQVVQQVEPLRHLLEIRKLLAELAQMVENNGELKNQLQRMADGARLVF